MDQNNNSTASKGWKKKLIIVLLVLIVLLGGVYLWRQFVDRQVAKFMQTLKSPTSTVSTTAALKQTWHEKVSAVGSLTASNGVDVNAEVAGQIAAINFKSGDVVRKGQVLLRLKSDVLNAQLANNKATLAYARVSYQRQRQLVVSDSASRAALDEAKAKYQEAQATLQQTEAQLAQKVICAPFTGIIGIRLVNVGQYLNPGTAIASLQALQPMYVDFNIPESELNKVRLGYRIEMETVAYPGLTFNGKITAINSTLANNTRSLEVRALVDNHSNKLLPQMFANVQVILPKTITVTVVPQIAINFSPSGDYVYVVNNNIAKRAYIKVGERRADVVAVTGLSVGDNVVYAGQVKLRNNAKVVVEKS